MISINLLRISPDSKYLEFDVECPANYRFNKLYIKKYDYTPNPTPVDTNGNPTDDGWRDLSHLLAGTGVKELMRISTLALSNLFNNNTQLTITPDANGNSASTMFYVHLGVWDYNDAGLDAIPDVISAVSDVNNVYAMLKDDILNLDVNCINQTDFQKLMRNYMFLYAHTESMKLERFDDSELFYDIIKKSFSSCQTNQRSTRTINNCNCR